MDFLFDFPHVPACDEDLLPPLPLPLLSDSQGGADGDASENSLMTLVSETTWEQIVGQAVEIVGQLSPPTDLPAQSPCPASDEPVPCTQQMMAEFDYSTPNCSPEHLYESPLSHTSPAAYTGGPDASSEFASSSPATLSPASEQVASSPPQSPPPALSLSFTRESSPHLSSPGSADADESIGAGGLSPPTKRKRGGEAKEAVLDMKEVDEFVAARRVDLPAHILRAMSSADHDAFLKRMSRHSLTGEEQEVLKSQRRLIKNRESAAVSRKRKVDRLNTLQGQVRAAREEARRVRDSAARELSAANKEIERLRAENARLRTQSQAQAQSQSQSQAAQTGMAGMASSLLSSLGEFATVGGNTRSSSSGKTPNAATGMLLCVLLFTFGVMMHPSPSQVTAGQDSLAGVSASLGSMPPGQDGVFTLRKLLEWQPPAPAPGGGAPSTQPATSSTAGSSSFMDVRTGPPAATATTTTSAAFTTTTTASAAATVTTATTAAATNANTNTTRTHAGVARVLSAQPLGSDAAASMPADAFAVVPSPHPGAAAQAQAVADAMDRVVDTVLPAQLLTALRGVLWRAAAHAQHVHTGG